MTSDALERHAAVIRDIAARHGAKAVRVFGSHARGRAGPGSDLDLLIDLEPGRDLLDLIAIQLDLVELLGIRVDAVTPSGLSRYIRDDVLADARPL
jgi:predicted nucleotidyltransferase